jgi:hypothetical protein
MQNLTLIHWKPAEAADRAQRLRDLGYAVTVHSDQGSHSSLREDPPAAFVIDLGRLPSHGREIGAWLRRQVATRGRPLVFVGGKADKVALVRALLPDATYTDWEAIAGDLPEAIAHPPAKPVVPGTMAGYSGTPLPKKLGIRAQDLVLLIDAPEDFEATLGELSEGVALRRDDAGPADVILLFAMERVDLLHRFPMAAEAMREGGRLWLAWPKKASGLQTDLGDAAVRAHGLAHGLVDYKVCAIDATWSGLCFARQGSVKRVGRRR